MNNTTPTPGPWEVHRTETTEAVRVAGTDGRTRSICTMSISMGREWPANARAIAALPELIEALESLVARRDEACKVHGIHRKDGSDGRYEKARAALAKVRGEVG